MARTLSSDTSPQAERVQIELLRAAPAWRRLALVADLNATLYLLAANRVDRQHGPLPPAETRRRLAETWLDHNVTARAYEAGLRRGIYVEGEAVATTIVAVTLLFIDALDALNIPYALGGSLASSAHGVSRSTLDADIVADVHVEHVDALVRALGMAFYIDDYAVRDAILHHSSFNAIHLQTMMKVDIFIPQKRPFDATQLMRRKHEVVSQEPERAIYIMTPEDVVLAKLEWYRLGNEVSERQWTDVVGVLKVQGPAIDRAYLRHWAAILDVGDLLERAFTDAGFTAE